MTAAAWGAVLGGLAGLGVIVVAARVQAIRRPQLLMRVLPYVRDLPQVGRAPGLRLPTPARSGASAGMLPGALGGIIAPLLDRLAAGVEHVLGGAASVQRRLDRAADPRSVAEFRVEQVLWGLAAFAVVAAVGVVRALGGSVSPVLWLLVCASAFALGVIWRDQRLTGRVRDRERRISTEFPAVAELLALSVAAGESPVAALDRVVRSSGGELSRDLSRVLADIRTGEPVTAAFDRMAAASGLPLVSRFAQGIAVAIERGTPLADVLHAQAGDVREAGRRELIEVAARREVLMMVPVVFLVLPIVVLFVFWPGFVGLSLTTG